MSSSLTLVLQCLFMTTLLGIKPGWLFYKEFDQTMKQNASYR